MKITDSYKPPIFFQGLVVGTLFYLCNDSYRNRTITSTGSLFASGCAQFFIPLTVDGIGKLITKYSGNDKCEKWLEKNPEIHIITGLALNAIPFIIFRTYFKSKGFSHQTFFCMAAPIALSQIVCYHLIDNNL